MAKFKVGDRVVFQQEDNSLFTDLLADLENDLLDRDISSAAYDRIEKALFAGDVWVVVAEADDCYEVKLVGSKITWGVWESRHFIAAPEKGGK